MFEDMGGDILSAIANMSDEDLAQLLQAGNAPNRSEFLERELRRAQELATPMGDYRTAGGAALGGLGSMIRSGVSEYRQHDARQGLEKQNGLMEDPRAMRAIHGAVQPQKSQQEMIAELLRGGGEWSFPSGGF